MLRKQKIIWETKIEELKNLFVERKILTNSWMVNISVKGYEVSQDTDGFMFRLLLLSNKITQRDENRKFSLSRFKPLYSLGNLVYE